MYEAIVKVISTRPFKPVQISFESGEFVIIKHPENVLVNRRWLVIMEPGTGTFITQTNKATLVKAISRRNNHK